MTLIDVSHLDLVRRVSAFYELVTTIAHEGSLEELASVVTTRIADVIGLERSSLWQFDLEEGMARRLGWHNEKLLDLPDQLPIDSAQVLTFLASNATPSIMEDAGGPLLGFSGYDGDIPKRGPVLVAPMIYRDHTVGVIIADRMGEQIEISDEMLELSGVIATQAAIAIDNAMRHDQENRRRLQLESMVDDLNGAVSAFDHRGRLTYFNEAELDMFDLDKDEVWLGQDLTDFVSRKRRLSLTGEPIAVDDNPLQRALRGERLQDLRQIVVRKNGEQRYVSTSSRPVFVDGELTGCVSVTRDVTAERASEHRDQRYLEQLEHALRRSQMIADVVVEINETSASLDVDALTRFAIDRIAKEFDAEYGLLWILGADQQFHLAATHDVPPDGWVDEGFRPEDFALASGALTRNKPVLADANAFRDREQIMRVSEDVSHVLIIPMRIRGQRTGVAYLGFTSFPVLDQTDEIFASVWGRQCAQAIDTAMLFHQVESAHGRLMAVIDQLPQAVLIVDREGMTVSVANRAADELWGFDVESGTDARMLAMHDSDGVKLEGRKHPLARTMHTAQKTVGEPLFIPQPDGTQVEVLGNHAPILDARDATIGVVSVLQNRADFETLDRAKDEFISVVAHELRNPLTSLRGNLQLLQRRMRKRQDEEVEAERQRVETALQQVDRVADLVSRMLDVSRVDMGSLDVSPGETDAVSLVREAINSAIGLEPSREFRVEAPETMPVVWDAARILQVLNNLMQNAARYAPGTLVEITVDQRANKAVRIRVRDHGPGVPKHIRRRLFKQYYRFDDGRDDAVHTAADGNRGLGIGLYISARLARAHGGQLSVDNHPEGGAIFTLDLPQVASRDDD